MAGDLNRRDAIRLALGRGDRIALEREQQSAIDAVRGYSTPKSAPEPAAPTPPERRSLLGRIGARLSALGPRFLRRTNEPKA